MSVAALVSAGLRKGLCAVCCSGGTLEAVLLSRAAPEGNGTPARGKPGELAIRCVHLADSGKSDSATRFRKTQC